MWAACDDNAVVICCHTVPKEMCHQIRRIPNRRMDNVDLRSRMQTRAGSLAVREFGQKISTPCAALSAGGYRWGFPIFSRGRLHVGTAKRWTHTNSARKRPVMIFRRHVYLPIAESSACELVGYRNRIHLLGSRLSPRRHLAQVTEHWGGCSPRCRRRHRQDTRFECACAP